MRSATQLIRRLAVLAMLLPSATAAGTVTYFHNDLAGSPVAASNSSGQVIWQEKYRPYGERIVNSPASGDNEIWFTSRRQDADTGLVYMGARYYDPVVGRFISKDPAGYDEGNAHSLNRYAYANNNPYRFVDPDGRAPTPFDLAFVVIDGARFLHALATGGDTKGTAIDLGISAGSIFIPIPGAALAIKAERAIEATRLANEIVAAERVGKALKEDPTHRAASFLTKEQLEAGRAFTIKGGDGVERSLLQVPGGLNGKEGIFEYIVRDGKVEHQRFIEGGTITGMPNQRVRRASEEP
jgi:RHS repeat-associated protein